MHKSETKQLFEDKKKKEGKKEQNNLAAKKTKNMKRTEIKQIMPLMNLKNKIIE
jgi:hypothetical protein